ncbi:MAG: hypothetical protein KF765_06960 [Parvibaculaceae bacterium]|nr:hypothetical protein [Parvibaculaceae bacterium]
MEQRLFRLLCALLAAFAAANGARMALDPLGWFASIPELALTGAANPHFIRDVGTAYLASAAGLALAAFRPAAGFGALLVAAIFMAGHGIGHLVDIAEGCAARPGGTALDWFGVIVPGAITAALCLWSLRFRPS